MIPQTSVPVEGGQARQVLALLEALEDLDDVQNVFANFDIPRSSWPRWARSFVPASMSPGPIQIVDYRRDWVSPPRGSRRVRAHEGPRVRPDHGGGRGLGRADVVGSGSIRRLSATGDVPADPALTLRRGPVLVERVPSGRLNAGWPSTIASPNPRWMARWCGRQSSTRLSSEVAPPSAQCLTWCASHQPGGRPQPGNRQPPSRTVTARRSDGGTTLLERPSSSGWEAPSVMTRLTLASQASRLADSGVTTPASWSSERPARPFERLEVEGHHHVGALAEDRRPIARVHPRPADLAERVRAPLSRTPQLR